MTIRNYMLASSALFAPETGNGKGKTRAQQRREANATTQVITKYYDVEGEEIGAEDIPSAYREALSDERDTESALDDAQISAIVTNIPGDEKADPQVRVARLDALIDAEEREELADLTAPATAQVNTPLASLARTTGLHLSAATDDAMNFAADKREELTGAPILLAFKLAKDWNAEFGEDGYLIRCPKVLEFPVPNSSDKEHPAGFNGPFDRYDVTVNGKNKRADTFGDMARSSHGGAELDQRIMDLEAIGTNNYDPAKIVNKEYLTDAYKGDEAKCRTSLLKRLKTRRTSRRGALCKAVAFLQVVTHLADRFGKKVEWAFNLPDAMKALDQVALLNYPVRIKDKGRDGGDTGPWSLTTFTNLQLVGRDGRFRFDYIAERGGKVAHFIDSMKKKTAEDGNQGDNKNKSGEQTAIPNTAQVDAFFSMFSTGFDPSEGNKAKADLYRAAIVRHLNATGDDADETLEVYAEVASILNEVLLPFGPRLAEIAERRTAAENKAAAERKAKNVA